MRAILAVLLLAVVGIGGAKLMMPSEPTDAKEPDPPPVKPAPQWKSVNLKEELARQVVADPLDIPFLLSIPGDWGVLERFGKGILFAGPWDDRFRPTVHLYWFPKGRRTVDEWCKLQRSKHLGGDYRELDYKKPVRTCGMNGALQVWEANTKRPNGEPIRTIHIDWCFGTDRGPKGILRGVSTGRTFPATYRAIFDEVQRRLKDLR